MVQLLFFINNYSFFIFSNCFKEAVPGNNRNALWSGHRSFGQQHIHQSIIPRAATASWHLIDGQTREPLGNQHNHGPHSSEAATLPVGSPESKFVVFLSLSWRFVTTNIRTAERMKEKCLYNWFFGPNSGFIVWHNCVAVIWCITIISKFVGK